jgi:hypothetical protein
MYGNGGKRKRISKIVLPLFHCGSDRLMIVNFTWVPSGISFSRKQICTEAAKWKDKSVGWKFEASYWPPTIGICL